ncbi:MAG: hypothetical protein E7589_05000 [Ruminococcaceae bacterium]|nr:hypothetical protein [Oscillospiraceae bacterium]
MRIVVCIKPSKNGDPGPFDAAAYEAALRVDGAEVILLSMAPAGSADMLLRLTRLGASEAYLLADKAFAGADTLATGYALGLALEKLKPDMVFCGRQTMEGDTAQVGVGIATRMGYSLATRVMEIVNADAGQITCKSRSGDEATLGYPALLTLEKIHDLRLPSIRSRVGRVITLTAADLGADISRCGLAGSPTRVVSTFENNTGKRKCKMISPSELLTVVSDELERERFADMPTEGSATPLKNVWVYGESAMDMALTVSDDVRLCQMESPELIAQKIRDGKPTAVLWDSSDEGKRISAAVAVLLETGLCADCTRLESDGERLYMYRPAFGGNIIAKIVCNTSPAMATVRTKSESAELIFGLGVGAAEYAENLRTLAGTHGAEIAASRGAVDMGLSPYPTQVGLTGKTVAPKVYVAFGISGAVHHLAGIYGAGTVIAVNSDKNAPIFEYADYGIIADIKDII